MRAWQRQIAKQKGTLQITATSLFLFSRGDGIEVERVFIFCGCGRIPEKWRFDQFRLSSAVDRVRFDGQRFGLLRF